MTQKPKVSVCIVTYNHQKYIAQAIEGAINQETNFHYEILIGDDTSTDSTWEIVTQYAERYPETIRPLRHIPNLGSGTRNLATLLPYCQGRYIAICEGDDYWIDRTKIQLQAEALDEDLSCALCFHNALLINEQGKATSMHTNPLPTITSIKDVLKRWYVPTASIMFRNGLVTPLPNWFGEMQSGDIALQLLLAHHGSFLYLDRIMSVYRQHADGLSATFTQESKLVENVRLLKRFNNHTHGAHEPVIRAALSQRLLKLASIERNQGRHLRSMGYAIRAAHFQPPWTRATAIELLRSVTPRRLLGSGVFADK